MIKTVFKQTIFIPIILLIAGQVALAHRFNFVKKAPHEIGSFFKRTEFGRGQFFFKELENGKIHFEKFQSINIFNFKNYIDAKEPAGPLLNLATAQAVREWFIRPQTAFDWLINSRIKNNFSFNEHLELMRGFTSLDGHPEISQMALEIKLVRKTLVEPEHLNYYQPDKILAETLHTTHLGLGIRGDIVYYDVAQVDADTFYISVIMDSGHEQLDGALYGMRMVRHADGRVDLELGDHRPLQGSRAKIERSALGADVPQVIQTKFMKSRNIVD